MSVNLYDLLDVEESASAAEIRAAWKDAVADLDPTDRRFRVFNDAAAVLLDPAKRQAYDEELAAARAEEEAEAEPGIEREPDAAAASVAAVEPAAETDADDVGEADEADEDTEAEDTEAEDAEAEDVAESAAEKSTATEDAGPSSGPPLWALVAAGVGAVLSIGLAVWVLTLPGVKADDGATPADVSAAADTRASAGADAQAVAETTIVPLLGYDYRTMDEDLANLQAQMTEAMAKRQAASWPDLTEQAKSQRIVVTAQAPYTALTRLSADGERAEVVAFIDQDVKKKGEQPFTLRLWATLTLVVGDDGDWVLDDICTAGDCS